jgi:peptidylprolyl isomerase
MKRFIPVFFILAIAIAPAFMILKGKKSPPVSDGVVRKYTSKPVKKPVVVKLSNGLEYTITSIGNGPAALPGYSCSMLYTGKLTNDTIFDASSRHGYQPLSFKLFKHQVIAGWDSVICHLHAGDKATMTIPAQYGYGARANGNIPANSTLIFDVEVLDVTPPPTPWDAKGKDTITTASGLKVILFEKHPENPMPATGQMVSVHYSGYLLDGSMFDSSVERGQPYDFPLGQHRVIQGWDEGIALLHKGETAKLIIPYNLAYGEGGRPPVIPAKATLVFDVQLVNIK